MRIFEVMLLATLFACLVIASLIVPNCADEFDRKRWEDDDGAEGSFWSGCDRRWVDH